MGVDKNRREVHAPPSRISSTAIQSISSTAGASTAAALTEIARGTRLATVTATSSGAGWEISLAGDGSVGPAGRPIGSEVTVVGQCNSTTPFTLLLETTAQTLFGSASNGFTWSTNSSGDPITVVKLSTSEYAITSGVVASVVPAASTGTV